MASGKRNARIEITSSAAGMDRGLNDARRRLRAFEREQKAIARARAREEKLRAKERAQLLRDNNSAIGKGITHGIGMAAGAAGIGAIGDAVHDVFDVEKEMTRFQIDAQQSDATMAGFRERIMQVSNATGQSRNALIHGAHAYQILTGDAKGAIESTKLFAEVANASGAEMNDIAATAASLRQNLGLDPADFQKGFDVLLSLGHKGSLELRDFAGEMSGLAPQFKQFGDSSAQNKLEQMGAAMEIIKFNFANASESATGFRAAMTAISKTKVADRLAAAGVDIWKIDPKTKKHVKRDFFDIIADIKKKIPDEKILADILGGRQESFRAITALLQHYNELLDLKEQAANSDQVSKDNLTWMNSASGKMALAWEHIKNAIAEALSPERIDRWANALVKAADFFSNAAGAVSQIINGPGFEEGKGNAAQDFLDAVHNGPDRSGLVGGPSDEEHHRNVVNLAFDALQGGDLAKGIGVQKYGSLEAYQAGAREFLASEGYDVGQSRKFGQTFADTTEDVNRRAKAQVAMMTDPAGFARTIGIEIARQLAPVLRQPPPVKIGAEPLVKATGNSTLQRTRPGGRA